MVYLRRHDRYLQSHCAFRSGSAIIVNRKIANSTSFITNETTNEESPTLSRSDAPPSRQKASHRNKIKFGVGTNTMVSLSSLRVLLRSLGLLLLGAICLLLNLSSHSHFNHHLHRQHHVVLLLLPTKTNIELAGLILMGLQASRSAVQAASPPSYNGNMSNSGEHNDRILNDHTGNGKIKSDTTKTATHHSNNNHSQRKVKHKNSQKEKQNMVFLKWCQTVLGIQTLLKVQDFEYLDHLYEWQTQDDNAGCYGDYDDNGNDEEKDDYKPRMITVRGLAATRNIEEGEIVISIPFHALISIHTTIDHDPVLSRILGPEARRKYGWSINTNANTLDTTTSSTGYKNQASYHEVPLLIVALLYHRSLGPELSPIWHYIETLLDDAATVDTMPYLWDRKTLKERARTDGVRKLARGIKGDMREMYDSVMGVLIRDHGNIFGPPSDVNDGLDEVVDVENSDADVNDDDDLQEKREWMFSYEKFKWAFAMVNSRHWHLPVADLNTINTYNNDQYHNEMEVPDPAETSASSTINTPNAPPAQQPTENWVSDHEEAVKREHLEEYPVVPTHIVDSPQIQSANNQNQNDEHFNDDRGYNGEDTAIQKHSFLAPLADMLNFGPPCTRGVYNSETKAFEVIATCPFLAGQEVTFWYSDDCDDVIIANYGFTHPMVPRCLSLEDWQHRTEMWKNYAYSLEESLEATYEDMDRLEKELEAMRHDCQWDSKTSGAGDSNESVKKDHSKQQDAAHQQKKRRKQKSKVRKDNQDVGIRGNKNGINQHQDNEEGNGGHGGIRRMWRRNVEDLGL